MLGVYLCNYKLVTDINIAHYTLSFSFIIYNELRQTTQYENDSGKEAQRNSQCVGYDMLAKLFMA